MTPRSPVAGQSRICTAGASRGAYGTAVKGPAGDQLAQGLYRVERAAGVHSGQCDRATPCGQRVTARRQPRRPCAPSRRNASAVAGFSSGPPMYTVNSAWARERGRSAGTGSAQDLFQRAQRGRIGVLADDLGDGSRHRDRAALRLYLLRDRPDLGHPCLNRFGRRRRQPGHPTTGRSNARKRLVERPRATTARSSIRCQLRHANTGSSEWTRPKGGLFTTLPPTESIVSINDGPPRGVIASSP